jgi:hypothetical protein
MCPILMSTLYALWHDYIKFMSYRHKINFQYKFIHISFKFSDYMLHYFASFKLKIIFSPKYN